MKKTWRGMRYWMGGLSCKCVKKEKQKNHSAQASGNSIPQDDSCGCIRACATTACREYRRLLRWLIASFTPFVMFVNSTYHSMQFAVKKPRYPVVAIRCKSTSNRSDATVQKRACSCFRTYRSTPRHKNNQTMNHTPV